MENILEIQNVNKVFGSQFANTNINLTVRKGTIFGILGPNGAGKTTLLRMITTISEPDSGTILFNGSKLSAAHSALMGYMPEERGLYKKMNVFNQLLFFAEIRNVPKAEAEKRIKYWVERLQMQDWTKKKLEELSKGMAQKVQFLSTILHEPQLIVLDEPFSGFDPINADLIKDLIIELKERGATIIFSTHRMDNVEELCDDICIIHKSKVALNGKSGELRRKLFENEFDLGFLENESFNSTELQPIQHWTTPDGRFFYRFKIHNPEERKQLHSMIYSRPNIVHFGENLPSIHDIFVKTVQNN